MSAFTKRLELLLTGSAYGMIHGRATARLIIIAALLARFCGSVFAMTRGPGTNDIRHSAMDTAIGERMRLKFRPEISNIFNYPTFALPDTVVGTSCFGQILSEFGRTLGFGVSRQIRLALNLRY